MRISRAALCVAFIRRGNLSVINCQGDLLQKWCSFRQVESSERCSGSSDAMAEIRGRLPSRSSHRGPSRFLFRQGFWGRSLIFPV